MSKEYEFIKECGYFYVLTINKDFPAGRPFGAMMEDEEGYLYIATNNENKVHEQLRNNGKVQIIAKKEGTRTWLRITGIAKECTDIQLKKKFMEVCPVLSKHYESAECERFLVFKIRIMDSEFQ